MKRKVDTKELQIGMYVSKLDRPWLETPFLFQGFVISSQGDINELRHYCQHVYIDEDRSNYTRVETPAPPPVPVSKEAASGYEKPAAKVSIEQEFDRAREVKRYAEAQVTQVLQLARDSRSFDHDQVSRVVSDLFESLIRNPDALLLLSSIKHHEQEAEAHAICTSILALTLGRFMKFSQAMVEELGVAALLHDIGEVRLSAEILRHGARTPEEVAQMKRHPEYGAQILRENHGIPESAIDAAYSHHEQIDGKGYPRGLKGEAITIFAKIVAIVDVYDKLTRGMGEQNMNPSEVLRYLYLYRDTLFDAKLTEAFIQCMGIYPVGSLVELASGEVGIVISSLPGEHLYPRLMLVLNADKRPYKPPRLINLATFAKGPDAKELYTIRQVLPADAYGVDIRAYLLNEPLL